MSSTSPITIQIAEDQAITRLGLKYALEAYEDLKVVAESADGVAAVLHALAVKPQVILMDIGLPKVDGIKAARQIKEALPGVRIIMFTSSEDDNNIHDALGAGADGYCLKNVAGEHLYSAIKAVTRGVAWLDPGVADRVLRSSRSRENASNGVIKASDAGDKTLNENQMLILQMLSQGATLDDVAKQLNRSSESVSLMVNATIALLNVNAGNASAQAAVADDSLTPMRTTLGERYTIESVLGRGGMGIVYKGKHRLMDRQVAIKMLHSEYAEDELVVRRFQSEAKSLSALSHPNLVAVFDFGITPAKEPYMVMDYHEGKGLDCILEDKSDLDLQKAINIFSQVCDALTAVHENNIVHRDIKPSNIVISRDGLVKLVDFGIAKNVDRKSMNFTMTGEVVGTPKYMSPEQCMGKSLDARSDLYALGCVMYETFTGSPPFEADSFYEMVRQHVDELPSRMPFLTPAIRVPPQLEAIIFKALQKEPDKRHQTAAMLKKDLLALGAARQSVG